ncbi:unnamed protein product [Zymoseptoria tritici ST99CH_1A5]|uniref:Phosphotyrosine-specific protein phosphatase n=3 Tax=Zymoseptoria tritici TaxID=1047171 RepID=F9XMY2_ZYMTI|nr:phosphotyrosine-specific protein phosphatase [Zymoseptoria tritici IPO323]EGP83319.1 phosphotyrosine-specific protein phosphatase [Zymoseptoria tritici IPO323]SMR60414.1 unnamed protein product [Zymoseptoria tritici ST99CH_1E4]SMY28872.1 unnamed protein product [Zymoseptoria tritici ST99CH_1A5]
MANNPPPLPAFLQQSKTDLHSKFVDLEWQQRNRLAQGTSHPANGSPDSSPFARLTGTHISSRNRYLNVEPFAANRVKLRVASASDNDYINASPISLGKRRYIATQGPKDTSVAHFYRMLLEESQNPAVVVMLTQTHESGKEKCFQYYPSSERDSPLHLPVKASEEEVVEQNGHEEAYNGTVELISVERHTPSRSEVRRMRLRFEDKPNQEREVRHLLFEGWPDFLVPEGDDRAALVELVRLSAALTTYSPANGSLASTLASASPSNPRIVHCSAGVGRSGTFIALDYLLSEMFEGNWDNLAIGRDPVAETVDELRKQRMMMVQGESQFMFLYEALREQWAKKGGGEDAKGGANR